MSGEERRGGEVVVQPSGISFDCDRDETILAAATRHGVHWPTICHGQAECRACLLTIIEGAEHFSGVVEPEAEALDSLAGGRSPMARLACQATVVGQVTVRKIGVRSSS